MPETQVKPLHEVMLPLWEKCEELRPKKRNDLRLIYRAGSFRWVFGAEQYGLGFEDADTSALICNATMLEWLIEQDCCPEFNHGRYGSGTTYQVVEIAMATGPTEYSAPTLCEALALACHAVLDEREAANA